MVFVVGMKKLVKVNVASNSITEPVGQEISKTVPVAELLIHWDAIEAFGGAKTAALVCVAPEGSAWMTSSSLAQPDAPPAPPILAVQKMSAIWELAPALPAPGQIVIRLIRKDVAQDVCVELATVHMPPKAPKISATVTPVRVVPDALYIA